MKTIFLSILLAAGLGLAQTAPVAPPQPADVTAASLASLQLPAYVAGGGAYNQFAGANLWLSAIVPVSNSAGIYESTTADLFPAKTTLNGKTGYIFTSSIREGAHKVVSNNGKFMTLIGADAGFSFAQASATTSASSGISASVTVTAVWQISKSFAVMLPVRALYLNQLGGWNLIAEVGLCWKPGAR